MGGIITLPISIPDAFGASWIIQASMAAGIAKISGHDVSSDKVKTFVIACLAGDACEEIVKGAGIKIGQGLAKSALQKVPGKISLIWKL